MSLESERHRQHERAVRDFLIEKGISDPPPDRGEGGRFLRRSVPIARDRQSSAIRDELAFGAVHRPTAFGHERIVHFTGPASELDDDASQESGASFEHTGEFRVTPKMDPHDWDPYHEEDR